MKEKQFYEQLGISLKRFRIARNMTQQELAKKVGYGQAFIAQIENGKRTLKVYEYRKILLVLKAKNIKII